MRHLGDWPTVTDERYRLTKSIHATFLLINGITGNMADYHLIAYDASPRKGTRKGNR